MILSFIIIVQEFPNKMVKQNINQTYLRYRTPSFGVASCPKYYLERFIILLYTLSILFCHSSQETCLLRSTCMAMSPIIVFFESLVVFVLCIFFNMNSQSQNLMSTYVGMTLSTKSIYVAIRSLIIFTCLVMLPFGNTRYSPLSVSLIPLLMSPSLPMLQSIYSQKIPHFCLLMNRLLQVAFS